MKKSCGSISCQQQVEVMLARIAAVLHPESVLTEVISQRMEDGLQDANRLGEAFPACKVILFSKNVQKASRFRRSGASDYRFPLVRRPQYPADIPPFVAGGAMPLCCRRFRSFTRKKT